MATPPGNAHLFPPPQFDNPPAVVRLVRDFTHGKQWGVDVARFGKPYVFTRYAVDGQWMLHAGPFASEPAAETWIQELMSA